MAEYSMSELAKMQLDAAERVREMGQRSRELTGGRLQGAGSTASLAGGAVQAPSGHAPVHGAEEGCSDRPGASARRRGDSPSLQTENRKKPPGEPPPPLHAEPPSGSSGFGWPGGLLSGLGNDRILLLLLLLLLGDDGKDRMLFLALAYLAL